MNTFMNFVKRSLVKEGTRGGVGAIKEVKASLLLVLDLFFYPASSFYSVSLAKTLMQRLCQAQISQAITKEV